MAKKRWIKKQQRKLLSNKGGVKDKLMSTKQAAALLGFTPDYIRRLCLDGTINGQKLGHDWIMTESALKHVVRQRKPKTSKKELV